ncbi:unnamed protein product, partial [Rotaria magnacalcarata]
PVPSDAIALQKLTRPPPPPPMAATSIQPSFHCSSLVRHILTLFLRFMT